MPFTSVDDLIAGFQPPVPVNALGITLAAVAHRRAYTSWYHPGNPGANVANAAGVNGQAVDPSLGTSVQGRIPRSNPSGGFTEARLARLAMLSNTAGSLWLVDRVWQNSGLSVTSTAAQAITPAAIPARDRNGLTDGDDIFFGIEWSATGGAGVPTVTLTYTDQDGNTGKTGTFTAVAAPPVGTVELFSAQAGSPGMRAPTSFQQSATRTSGTMHLVGWRLIAQLDFPQAGGAAVDPFSGGMARIYNDSVLQLMWLPTGTTAPAFIGSVSEVWK
jgi:hypothetical protein